MLNKIQWATLTERERDTLITGLIKPFQPTDLPDDFTLDDAARQWVHPKDGILCSQSYPIRHIEGKPQFGHQWRKFKPTILIEDALILLDRDFKHLNTLRSNGHWQVGIARRTITLDDPQVLGRAVSRDDSPSTLANTICTAIIDLLILESSHETKQP